ncbi:uncharacterized protein LOC115033294 [Acyrthosiphon pisum]|uniref:Secreted protein n=1 Tax=Acyrthosiphon pisum TaxID=7029 RepID=A0A8R2JLS2_ACYPI|nr:uncharacterized protein LOC115033294 [Acyrthosiphon pisum]
MLTVNLILFLLTTIHCSRIKSELNKFKQTDDSKTQKCLVYKEKLDRLRRFNFPPDTSVCYADCQFNLFLLTSIYCLRIKSEINKIKRTDSKIESFSCLQREVKIQYYSFT